MPSDFPRRYKAAHAANMAAEIRKNVPLEPGEEIVFSVQVQIRRSWLFMQLGMLALTSSRLILLEHSLFSSDWILELPRSAIVGVSADQGATSPWLEIAYTEASGSATLRLRPFVFRGSPSSSEYSVMLDVLRDYSVGRLSARSEPSAARRNPEDPPSYSSAILFALLCLLLIARLGVYYVNLPAEWRAKRAYDASPSCTSANLVESTRSGARSASGSPSAGSFCMVQAMMVVRVWSTRRAPYQHLALMDARGKSYDDIGALNSVDAASWQRMRPGTPVWILLAGDRPAWIMNGTDLFETRQNPDHDFWEQLTLMLGGTVLCVILLAVGLWYRRRKSLAHSYAAATRAVAE